MSISETMRDRTQNVVDSLGKIKGSIRTVTSSINEEELILFLSFDLVNSTEYKSRNYNRWFPVLIEITERIKELVLKKIEHSQMWRSIGDEIVFIVNITNYNQLESAVQNSFIILNEIIKEIQTGEILNNDKFDIEEKNMFIYQNVLSLKATSWIALVSKTSDVKKENRGVQNLMYMYNHDTRNGIPTYEFQGNDIDTGFRLTRYTRNRRLVLSLELAYLLSQNQLLDDNVNIITYKKLKGIWNEKMYPVIWYHDSDVTSCKLDDSFTYDEYYTDDITKEYLDKEFGNIRLSDKNTTFKKIAKIVSDKNMDVKINRIKKYLEKENKTKMLMDSANILEVHAVSVCVNFKTRQVLMFKRGNKCEFFGGKWDFGCCPIKTGQSFSETLTKDYKAMFNIDIKVLDPIKEYKFQDDNKKTIPGIRFLSEVEDTSELKINTDDYEEYRLIEIDKFEKIDKQEQEDFINYKEFLEVIKSIKKYLEVEKSNE